MVQRSIFSIRERRKQGFPHDILAFEKVGQMGLGEGWGVKWGKDTHSRDRMIVERFNRGRSFDF